MSKFARFYPARKGILAFGFEVIRKRSSFFFKGLPGNHRTWICLKKGRPIPCFIISIFLVKLATFQRAKSPDVCFDALKLRPDVFKWESQNGGYPHFIAKTHTHMLIH